MKILLLIFVAMALILGNLQANAKRVAFVDRKLLSHASLGKKVSVGVNDKVVINGNKATEDSENKTSTDVLRTTTTTMIRTRAMESFTMDLDRPPMMVVTTTT
ncbi:hypothetical protein Acr_24g0000840 [Actinidia rufa]|uniref:Uncharacterized protein n=1 Tax=Actinidia rufa TaxID=165716 RepID=A0A7J0GTM2_9ERIC|nr:hypothetical protein Acr_24g0000840 [Actinidia rufa]